MKGSVLMIGFGGRPKPPGFLKGKKKEEEEPKGPPKKEEVKAPEKVGPPPEKEKKTSLLSPERAGFHNQEESCSVCSYFTQGEGGGSCSKVEVDFASSEPENSWCSRFEGSGEEEELEEAS